MWCRVNKYDNSFFGMILGLKPKEFLIMRTFPLSKEITVFLDTPTMITFLSNDEAYRYIDLYNKCNDDEMLTYSEKLEIFNHVQPDTRYLEISTLRELKLKEKSIVELIPKLKSFLISYINDQFELNKNYILNDNDLDDNIKQELIEDFTKLKEQDLSNLKDVYCLGDEITISTAFETTHSLDLFKLIKNQVYYLYA